jgi:hypothetical protein
METCCVFFKVGAEFLSISWSFGFKVITVVVATSKCEEA